MQGYRKVDEEALAKVIKSRTLVLPDGHTVLDENALEHTLYFNAQLEAYHEVWSYHDLTLVLQP